MSRDVSIYIVDILIAQNKIERLDLSDAITSGQEEYSYNREVLALLSGLEKKL